MIVYGDPSFQESLRSLTERLLKSVSVARDGSPDDLRRVLIEAGMLEQAVADEGLLQETDWAQQATHLAASAFQEPRHAVHHFEGMRSFLDALARRPDRRLTVKTPEGFAFYGLYPEAYALAADAWARENPTARDVLVVGVRSIGTTLSALVTEHLARYPRLRRRRVTVRPSGHPFDRETHLTGDVLRMGRVDRALVVDEGPGLSGSSMASVAEALVRLGYSPERIAFLPGHGGEPGREASEAVRAWWRETPRFVVPTEALRWAGRTLEDTLADATEDAASVEELTGGRWRELVYDEPADGPGVASAFERRKLLVRRRDGAATLWKFAGLAVEGATLGFAPTPWIEGRALRREDATPDLLADIGRHIGAAAGPPLSAVEGRAAWERLVGMVRHNLAEAGLSSQPSLRDEPLEEGGPAAGDYRLAPWEWRMTDGVLVKAGRIAPTLDHTVVGRQPVAWDVAGATVEWGLDEAAAAPLLAAAPPVPPEALRFYRTAYAAFRMGMCRMGNADEADRLRRDEAFYREGLRRIL